MEILPGNFRRAVKKRLQGGGKIDIVLDLISKRGIQYVGLALEFRDHATPCLIITVAEHGHNRHKQHQHGEGNGSDTRQKEMPRSRKQKHQHGRNKQYAKGIAHPPTAPVEHDSPGIDDVGQIKRRTADAGSGNAAEGTGQQQGTDHTVIFNRQAPLPRPFAHQPGAKNRLQDRTGADDGRDNQRCNHVACIGLGKEKIGLGQKYPDDYPR